MRGAPFLFRARDPADDDRSQGWATHILLLLLRIPYSIFFTYGGHSDIRWASATYELGTYALTAFLIWLERKDLVAMHMDPVAIGLIVLFKPLQTLILQYWGLNTPLTFPHPASLLIWLIAITLIASLWKSAHRSRIGMRPASVWLLAGLLTGVALSSLLAFDAFQNAQKLVPSPAVSASTGLDFFYQIGFAAVSEEPVFRGFLWGYLRLLGWRDLWIWVTQAALFMVAHLYFIDALQLQFWVLVPAAGLICGLFAWRSRSIAPGMLAHAAYNAGAYVLLLNALAALIKLA